MNYPIKLTVDSEEFVNNFLNPISKCTDQAIINITPTKIYSLISTPNDLILYAQLKGIIDVPLANNEEIKINVGNTKKLYSMLNNIEEDKISLDIDFNNIKYTSTNLKFKYFLLDDSLSNKVPLNISKVENFTHDTEFILTFDQLQSLLKNSSFTQTNKLYINTTVDKKVIVELNDLTKQNIDSLTMTIADSYQGKDIPEAIPFELELFRNFIGFKTDINIKINSEYKVLIFDINIGAVSLRYIALSLVK